MKSWIAAMVLVSAAGVMAQQSQTQRAQAQPAHAQETQRQQAQMQLAQTQLAQTQQTQAQTQQVQTPVAPVPTKPRLMLSTDAFEDGGIIPNKFTMAAEGTAVSPKLTWSNVPDGTVSFALILIDPDTAVMKKTDEVLHWMMFNIPGPARELAEGMPAQAQLADGSIQGLNQGKKVGYMGMGAAAVGPYHHYTFELYALDIKLTLGPDATQSDVMKAMDGHILMKGVLVGRFHRP